MDIFITSDNKVAPTAETLTIEPFKTIWETNDKDTSVIKFAYIEFMCSLKKSNPFIGYKIEERPIKILLSCFPNGTKEEYDEIMEDTLIAQGMEFYSTTQSEASPTLRFYESALKAAESMTEFFDDIDLKATNAKNGNLLYKPADITRALKDVNDVIKTLTSMKQKVVQEITEDAKGKAGREINYFEKSKDER